MLNYDVSPTFKKWSNFSFIYAFGYLHLNSAFLIFRYSEWETKIPKSFILYSFNFTFTISDLVMETHRKLYVSHYKNCPKLPPPAPTHASQRLWMESLTQTNRRDWPLHLLGYDWPGRLSFVLFRSIDILVDALRKKKKWSGSRSGERGDRTTQPPRPEKLLSGKLHACRESWERASSCLNPVL
jgi:hypothetical protein